MRTNGCTEIDRTLLPPISGTDYTSLAWPLGHGCRARGAKANASGQIYLRQGNSFAALATMAAGTNCVRRVLKVMGLQGNRPSRRPHPAVVHHLEHGRHRAVLRPRLRIEASSVSHGRTPVAESASASGGARAPPCRAQPPDRPGNPARHARLFECRQRLRQLLDSPIQLLRHRRHRVLSRHGPCGPRPPRTPLSFASCAGLRRTHSRRQRTETPSAPSRNPPATDSSRHRVSGLTGLGTVTSPFSDRI